MKYKIGNTVINSDHIVRVDLLPNNQPWQVGIVTNEADTNGLYAYTINGDNAVKFWQVYSGDALDVLSEAQP